MCRRHPRTRTLLQETIRLLHALNRKVDRVSENQDKVNAYAEEFGGILDDIRGDVAVLKQKAEEAGAPLDFSSLEARLADARQLADENPTAPPAEPTEPTEPTEPSGPQA
jgi:hypothetical protein